MAQVNDLTGQRFGRLFVVSRAQNNSRGRACWVCRCDCGNTKIVVGSNLLQGHTNSCGCILRKHGLTHKERLYNIWTGMRQRCMNENSKDYPKYGGRGINVCPDWQNYESFRAWAISNGYRDDLSIDRIDVDGNYEPSNCRWTTSKQQNNNRRSNLVIRHDGQDLTVSQLAEATGLPYKLLRQRLARGWSVERAVASPVRSHRKASSYASNPA